MQMSRDWVKEKQLSTMATIIKNAIWKRTKNNEKRKRVENVKQ